MLNMAVLVYLVDDPVSVFLHTGREHYYLIEFAQLLQELNAVRSHEEVWLLSVHHVVNQRLIQVQYKRVLALVVSLWRKERRLDLVSFREILCESLLPWLALIVLILLLCIMLELLSQTWGRQVDVEAFVATCRVFCHFSWFFSKPMLHIYTLLHHSLSVR